MLYKNIKSIIVICLCVFVKITNAAQQDTTFIIHRHKNKVISTKQIKLTNTLNWGYVKAYDNSGKEIYFKHIRNIAGHASVDFTYYTNGAVKTAHFESHPDGGIQWDDITHSFDENGNLLQIIDNSSDAYGNYKLSINPIVESDSVIRKLSKAVVTPSKKQEVMPCAELFITELYGINKTRKNRELFVELRNTTMDGFKKEINLIRNDTVLLFNYVEAELFTHPKARIQLNIKQKKTEGLKLVWEECKQVDRTKRQHYVYLIEP